MIESEDIKQIFYKKAAHLIKSYRVKKGMTGEVFGEHIGVTKGAIAGYEHGKTRIPGDTMYCISKELGFEFAEYDPEIPRASEILRQIIEFKKKRKQDDIMRMGFTTSWNFSNSRSPKSGSRVQLKEDHRLFFDEYMANADSTKRKSLELIYELMKQYCYYQEMSRSTRSLYDRAVDYIFEDKAGNKEIIIEIRGKYQI